MLRCATGEGWQEIMMSCTSDKLCAEGSNKIGKECGSTAAYPYFTSFVFLSSFLVLLI